jgi:hypothetical protein
MRLPNPETLILEVEENEKVNKEEERIQGQHVEIEDFKEKMLLFNF